MAREVNKYSGGWQGAGLSARPGRRSGSVVPGTNLATGRQGLRARAVNKASWPGAPQPASGVASAAPNCCR